MEILHDQNKNRFYLKDSEEIGYLVYSYMDRNKISLDSTWIEEEYRGENLGSLLVEALVTFSRENNIKIVPVCSFAKKIFNENLSEYKDVLK